MTFFGLKMIISGHFWAFLASFKISFSSLHNPSYREYSNSSFVDEMLSSEIMNMFNRCITSLHCTDCGDCDNSFATLSTAYTAEICYHIVVRRVTHLKPDVSLNDRFNEPRSIKWNRLKHVRSQYAIKT